MLVIGWITISWTWFRKIFFFPFVTKKKLTFAFAHVLLCVLAVLVYVASLLSVYAYTVCLLGTDPAATNFRVLADCQLL
jgi:hypothetical protein